MKDSHIYAAIDLKSFYASAECAERHLDPLRTNLVVADLSRTEKTICLAVSPPLKALGISGRPRLFEVAEKVREINAERILRAPGGAFTGTSSDAEKLRADPSLSVGYITAVPRMAFYMRKSAQIYDIYLRYISPEDIHVYSIDEVMIDLAPYLGIYGLSPRALVTKLIREVLRETGITATAGIGTNLYLAKVAMDIVAKHIDADEDGVRIAELDEMAYRRLLWNHRPLTDFWRVGRGYAKKLENVGIRTMGDIARCSEGKPSEFWNEDLLYHLFGVNAELLIDHAWGYEPVTIADIRAFRPEQKSLGGTQVLACPSDASRALLIAREMADRLSLELFDKGLTADQLVLTLDYDKVSSARADSGRGKTARDIYGRTVPLPSHGSIDLAGRTSSTRAFMEAATALFQRIAKKDLLIRRITIAACHVSAAKEQKKHLEEPEQLNLFTDYSAREKEEKERADAREKEKKLQQMQLSIRKKFGQNSLVRGMDLEEGATALERNRQIGGHRA